MRIKEKAHELKLVSSKNRVVLYGKLQNQTSKPCRIGLPHALPMAHFFAVLHLTIKKKRETLSLKPLRPTHCWRVDLVSSLSLKFLTPLQVTYLGQNKITHWESYHSHILDSHIYVYKYIYHKCIYIYTLYTHACFYKRGQIPTTARDQWFQTCLRNQ